jgi:ribonucleoside-diphosphate reductase alpha chain
MTYGPTSKFARDIANQKYLHTLPDGSKESWTDLAKRVSSNVLGAVDAPKDIVGEVENTIRNREFMPGGRYLYASGRPFHQTQNCLTGETKFLTSQGLRTFAETVDRDVVVQIDGRFWAEAKVKSFGVQELYKLTLSLPGFDNREIYTTIGHSWRVIDETTGARVKTTFSTGELVPGQKLWTVDIDWLAWTVVSVEPTSRKEVVYCAVVPDGNEFVLEGDILTGNCLLKTAEDSREGWAEHMRKVSLALMTGAGVGVVYSNIRAKGRPIRKTGGVASGPTALMQMTNEAGRHIQQGGSRRAALWAGLHWNHPDVGEFIRLKDWSPEIQAMKAKDFNASAPLDMTNISVILDDLFFQAYHDAEHQHHSLANTVYWEVVRHMLETGEPGFSVDVGVNSGEHLRNACTEVSSKDDDDICNLGSINLARIKSLDHFRSVLESSVAFLLAGTVYSDVPYVEVDRTRTKNRRLGLGLMGVHEWLLLHGKRYGADAELQKYLEVYEESTKIAASLADSWDLSRPVKTRAIAPTGTIGLLAETSQGIEPLFCAAYKRRYLKGTSWNYQYVIDPTAAKLVEQGIDPDDIEDAYSLSEDTERRVSTQAWMQKYVDHGISSTINLPRWGSEQNNESLVKAFGDMLISYLPRLRGITCYPDGSRGGQPLSAVKFRTAAKHIGQVFQEGGESVAFEGGDVCSITKGGSCGS